MKYMYMYVLIALFVLCSVGMADYYNFQGVPAKELSILNLSDLQNLSDEDWIKINDGGSSMTPSQRDFLFGGSDDGKPLNQQKNKTVLRCGGYTR